MAGFLYYKPHAEVQPKAAALEAWGLSYAFETLRPPVGTICQTNTPDGARGYVFADEQRFADEERGAPIRMDMDNQTWRKIPKSDVWVGFWNEVRPEPEDLERPILEPGWIIPVGDYRWSVPRVWGFRPQRLVMECALACYLDLDENGEFVDGETIEYAGPLARKLQGYADKLLQQATNPDLEIEIDERELQWLAVEILQMNYVVAAAELVAIQALTNRCTRIVSAACDDVAIHRWQMENATLPLKAQA